MFYKMTLQPLPRRSRRDRKKVSEHNFQTSEYDTHLKPECELNHASRLPTLGLTKSEAKRVCLERNSRVK